MISFAVSEESGIQRLSTGWSIARVIEIARAAIKQRSDLFRVKSSGDTKRKINGGYYEILVTFVKKILC